MTTPGSWIGSAADPIDAVEAVDIEYACNVTTAVGDVVIFSTITVGKVDELTSNVYGDLALGIVKTKTSTITCVVRLFGELSGFSGLSPGRRVFVGTGGAPTTTKPATGHLQIIGKATSATEILVNAAGQKVIQV